MDHERRVFLQLMQDELPTMTLRELGEILVGPAARSVGSLPVTTLLAAATPPASKVAAEPQAASMPRTPVQRRLHPRTNVADLAAAPSPQLRPVPTPKPPTATSPRPPIAARAIEPARDLEVRPDRPVANSRPAPAAKISAPAKPTAFPQAPQATLPPAAPAPRTPPQAAVPRPVPQATLPQATLPQVVLPQAAAPRPAPPAALPPVALPLAASPQAAARRIVTQLEIAHSPAQNNFAVVRSAVSRTLAHHNRQDPDTLIIAALRGTREWIRARDLRPRVGLQPDDLRSVLNRMVKAGTLRREGEGPDTVYQLVTAESAAN